MTDPNIFTKRETQLPESLRGMENHVAPIFFAYLPPHFTPFKQVKALQVFN